MIPEQFGSSGNAFDLYSGGVRFKSRLGHRLFLLGILVFFSVTSDKGGSIILKYATTTAFKSFEIKKNRRTGARSSVVG
jgi:hypothetical protein